MSDNRSDQVTVPLALRNHANRIGILEAQVGRWVYVLPMAPATPPPNFQVLDPLSPTFQNGITNIAGGQPFSFRIHPATKVQIRGDIDLQGNSLPVVICTLPPGYRPMQGPTVIQWGSQDGSLAWQGRVDPSGDVWILSECGCGGPTTSGQESFSGNNVTIANGNGDFLTWDNPGGDALLDISNPAQPTVFTAGIYAIMAVAYSGTNMTVGGTFFPALSASGLNLTGQPALSTAANQTPAATLTAVWKLAAGDAIDLIVNNNDGVSAIDFFLNGYVQRIS